MGRRASRGWSSIAIAANSFAITAATTDLPAQTPGTLIGPYKLLQEIGEGGMGTVFMAEQTEPVQRMVAASSSCSTVKAAMRASRSGSTRTGAGGVVQLVIEAPMANAIGVARNVRLLTDDMAGSIPRAGSVELLT